MIWIPDAPPIEVCIMDSVTYAAEIFYKRYHYPLSRNISIVDDRRIQNPMNRVGESRSFTNLRDDLQRIDLRMKIKAMPRDASQAAEVFGLIDDWEQKFPNVWNYESKVPTPVAIPNCQYLTRFPADERWSSRDVGMTFAKMAMMKPCLKVIETEPIIRRRNLSKYEEELQSLEDHIRI